MTRHKAEAWIAILFAAGILAVGGAAAYFFATMSVHSDPASIPSTASVAPADRWTGAVEAARRLTRSLLINENLPGLSVAVSIDGRTVWAEGFGWADVDQQTPMTPLTRMRIGSVSKTLTAAAAGLLHDRSRLDLDAPVQQYVPAYPAKQWPVSTRQLLGDVAGVHHLRGDQERMPGRHCARIDDALAVFKGDPLLFKPGTKYRFSIYGWILASLVIEGAAAEPFSAFMKREVLKPVGMDNTELDEAEERPGRATRYFPRMDTNTALGLQDAPEADYSCWAGAGAFLSTPSDLVKFGSVMLKPGLLKAETITLLQTPLTLESGASSGYALGWKVERVQLAGVQTLLLSHRGTPMGGTVTFMIVPERGIVIAIASNISYARGVEPLGRNVAEAFAKQPRQ